MKGKNGFFVNINTCMDEVKKVCQKSMKIFKITSESYKRFRAVAKDIQHLCVL